MFLSKARLNACSPNLLATLQRGARVDGAHQLIWSLFDGRPGQRRDYLWRELNESGQYLILSRRPPASPIADLWDISAKPWIPAINTGDPVRFVLRANPVRTLATQVCRADGRRQHGKRVDVVMHARYGLDENARGAWTVVQTEQAALAWLFERSIHIGLQFDAENCMAMAYRQRRLRGSGGKNICFSTVDFEGVAIVADAEALQRALQTGVGKARAYGCGMLLVRPA